MSGKTAVTVPERHTVAGGSMKAQAETLASCTTHSSRSAGLSATIAASQPPQKGRPMTRRNVAHVVLPSMPRQPCAPRRSNQGRRDLSRRWLSQPQRRVAVEVFISSADRHWRRRHPGAVWPRDGRTQLCPEGLASDACPLTSRGPGAGSTAWPARRDERSLCGSCMSMDRRSAAETILSFRRKG